jgi:hypothetical protein
VTKTRRGSTVALTAAGVRGQLRRQLLHSYDSDAEFGRALIAHWLKRARRLRLEPDWRTIRPLLWVEEPSSRAVRDEFESRADVQILSCQDRARVCHPF